MMSPTKYFIGLWLPRYETIGILAALVFCPLAIRTKSMRSNDIDRVLFGYILQIAAMR
jgi:hypothetical protein